MITDLQKTIYNYWLRAYRINNGQPYRPKKDFTDIEGSQKALQLGKLANTFGKSPHLLRAEFFDAPYKLYPDEKKYYGLDFFSSHKGLGTCIAYFKHLTMANPDNQIDYFAESLKFIANFCVEKGIPLHEYVSYKSVAQNDFLKHLKEHRISWYIIFGIPALREFLHALPDDEFELYFGTDIDLGQMYNQYMTSQKARTYITTSVRKIEKYILKHLKKD